MIKKILSPITNFFNQISSSLDNHSSGWSGRKLSAVTAMGFAFYVHYLLRKMVISGKNEEAILETLFWFDVIDLVFVLLCLGIVTFEQIIKLKMSKEDTKKSPEVNEKPVD
jgi:hypothetical protein